MSGSGVVHSGPPPAAGAHEETTAIDAAVDRQARLVGIVQRSAALIVLALALVAGTLLFPRFAEVNNFRNILESRFDLALIAVGMTFVIISGGIDLSVGSVMAVSAVLTAYSSTNYSSLAAVVVPLVVCALIGLVNGLLIARGRLAPFIVTLATLLGARGLALKITDNGTTKQLVPDDAWILKLGRNDVLGVPVPILFAIAAFVTGFVVLNRTRFGQSVFAVGGAEDAANLMGLPVRRIKVGVYVASALLAGVAGMIVAARAGTGEVTLGQGMELQAIAAVVIGGTLLTGGSGGLGGTAAGVVLLGVISNMINLSDLPNSYYQGLVSGLFLLVVVVVQTLLARKKRT
jgi:ribose transport system permease protein